MRIMNIALALALSAVSGFASVSFNLSKVWSELPGYPGGPWGTVTFENTGVTDQVQVSITATNLNTGEFISDFYFNFSNSSTAQTATFSITANPTGTTPDIHYGTSTTQCGDNAGGCRADGDGRFDARFLFDTAGANRFTNGETFTVLITSAGITEAIGNLRSETSDGDLGYRAAIHLQGINFNGTSCSAWIGDAGGNSGQVTSPGACGYVPEPIHSGMYLGIALAGGAYLLRRRSAKK